MVGIFLGFSNFFFKKNQYLTSVKEYKKKNLIVITISFFLFSFFFFLSTLTNCHWLYSQ